jgi:hypothetical protein
MRFRTLPVALLASLLAPLASPSPATPAAPPNRADPCAKAGHNTCGTLGVGFYKVYRYGIRWFGDYRGVLPGATRAFCIDLRYWYASRAYRYRAQPVAGLRNREGERVPTSRLRELSYAVWNDGRSTTPDRQAAVMLYVHSRMGDARPGELSASAVKRSVALEYARIARDAARFHGPYRVQTRVPAAVTVGQPATATIRVLAASGHAVPNVRLTLSASNARTPGEVTTDAQGVARVTLTATGATDVRLTAKTEALAATLPRIYSATVQPAMVNSQRLAAPASQRVTATAGPLRVRAVPRVTTVASNEIVQPGTPIHDRIHVEGLGTTAAGIEVEVYGPFASRAAIRCTGTPYWKGRITAQGNGELRSPAVRVKRAGFYTFRERVFASERVVASTAECGLTSETTLAAPRIVTGRGDVARGIAVASAGSSTPTRVRIATHDVDAPVAPVGIDAEHGVLGVPASIQHTGWWKDGAAPGSRTGAVLIAGHVDSATDGAGAFFALPRVRRGERVQVATRSGRTFAYRVTSVQTYPKGALPTTIYSLRGPARLVLVTCGGPFDELTGRYRDNVVVTAVAA